MKTLAAFLTLVIILAQFDYEPSCTPHLPRGGYGWNAPASPGADEQWSFLICRVGTWGHCTKSKVYPSVQDANSAADAIWRRGVYYTTMPQPVHRGR